MRHFYTVLGVLLALAAASGDTAASTENFHQRYLACLRMTDDVGRLKCYDALAQPDDGGRETAEQILHDEEIAAITASDPGRDRRVEELDHLARRERSGILQSDDPNYFV